MSWLVHRNIFSPISDSYTLSLYSNSLDGFPVSLSVPNFLRLLLPLLLIFMIINSQPCHNLSPSLLTPTGFFFRCRPQRIVLRIFGCCPRAGLFAAATLCRFWNSVATNAWLGFALAAFCAFYAVFASPSQDKLSGL